MLVIVDRDDFALFHCEASIRESWEVASRYTLVYG